MAHKARSLGSPHAQVGADERWQWEKSPRGQKKGETPTTGQLGKWTRYERGASTGSPQAGSAKPAAGRVSRSGLCGAVLGKGKTRTEHGGKGKTRTEHGLDLAIEALLPAGRAVSRKQEAWIHGLGSQRMQSECWGGRWAVEGGRCEAPDCLENRRHVSKELRSSGSLRREVCPRTQDQLQSKASGRGLRSL